MTYPAYNFLLACVAWFTVPYYLLRALFKGQKWSTLTERFGLLPSSLHQTAPGAIWLHAVSVGEVLSCAQLVKTLRARMAETPIFVSTTTTAGRQMAHEKLARWADGIFYVPFDLPFAVRRVMKRIRPRLVIVAETEIWPNLFRQAKLFGAGLMVVNARMSNRSFSRYRRLRFFFSRVLQYPDVILAQSATDRERFIAAGAPPGKTQVGGNLKYDFEPAGGRLPPELEEFFKQLRPKPIIVAGSTRETEEALVVEAFRRLAQRNQRALLVLAPRHPRRFEEVAETLASAAIPFRRRSQLNLRESGSVPLPGVLLLDSLGELSTLYPLADVVFIGGSLNGWGGHNVLEPALSGRPVIVGPAMQNFRAIADDLLAQQAMVQIKKPEDLATAFAELVDNPEKAASVGRRGRSVAQSRRGATERAVSAAMHLHGLAIPRIPPSRAEYLLLGLPALVWGAVVRVRFAIYRRGWAQTRRLRTFTLCVGNLTTGGVGKTPMVLWLVEQLHARGRRAGVLLRGYRRVSPEAGMVVQPGTPISPLRSGDEGQILLRHFQRLGIDVPLGIGANRYEVGSELEGSRNLDVVILDDGFQHVQLERDLDLLLIDVTSPLDGAHMLPLGRLREPVSGLGRAGAVVLTRTEPHCSYEGLENRVRASNPRAPIFRSRSRLVAAVNTATGEQIPLEELRSKPILGLCGVGNPDSFWRSLEQSGLTLVQRMRFRDHHRYTPLDVRSILLAARHRKAELLVTTEKDLVNLWHAADSARSRSTNLEATVAELFAPLPLYWLRMETEVEDGAKLLDWIEGRLAASRERPPKAPVLAGQHSFG